VCQRRTNICLRSAPPACMQGCRRGRMPTCGTKHRAFSICAPPAQGRTSSGTHGRAIDVSICAPAYAGADWHPGETGSRAGLFRSAPPTYTRGEQGPRPHRRQHCLVSICVPACAEAHIWSNESRRPLSRHVSICAPACAGASVQKLVDVLAADPFRSAPPLAQEADLMKPSISLNPRPSLAISIHTPLTQMGSTHLREQAVFLSAYGHGFRSAPLPVQVRTRPVCSCRPGRSRARFDLRPPRLRRGGLSKGII